MNSNDESKDTLTIAVTGVLTIGRGELEQLLGRVFADSLTSGSPVTKSLESGGTPKRMGFTVKQTAELLGVGNETAYRLLKRGLLRSSSALRTKLIPRADIERFLKETTQP
jgi:excisionase family DNA binding protein